MKKFLSVITLVLLAVPALAQDDFGGFGGFEGVLSGSDLDALLGGGNRNRGNQNNNIPDPEAMFLQMKDLLKVQKAPLSKDQEKALKPLLVTEIQAMREYLEAQFGNRNNQNNQNNQNRGNSQVNMVGELFKTITKHNTELLTTIKSDLAPDQAALITKGEKDKKVCLVLLDLINPQQMGNRGGNNNNNFNNNLSFPGGFDGFEGFGGGFDGGGGRGGRGGGGRGGSNNSFQQAIPDRPFCTSGSSTPAERVAPLAQVLTKGKKPLTSDQEKKFAELIDARLKLMEEEAKQSNPQMASLLSDLARSRNNTQNNNSNNQNVNPQQLRNNIVNTIMSQLGIPNNNNNNNRGGRGGNNNNNAANTSQNNPQSSAGAPANNSAANSASTQNNDAANSQGRGNRGNNNFNPQAEIQKKNEELLDKIAASLNPNQGKVVKKFKYDQIKVKGGAERYRAIMDEEGTPLTPEQFTQIQSLFNGQNQAIRQYADQQVQQEMTATPPPAAAPAPAPQENQGRGNQNSVGQNPYAQQIVAKVLPLVSRQRALLEKVTQDTIMKLLTPPQVASYKINSL